MKSIIRTGKEITNGTKPAVINKMNGEHSSLNTDILSDLRLQVEEVNDIVAVSIASEKDDVGQRGGSPCHYFHIGRSSIEIAGYFGRDGVSSRCQLQVYQVSSPWLAVNR